MTNIIFKAALAATATALLAANPAYADERLADERWTVSQDSEILVTGNILPVSQNDDGNSYWLDYRTDISEAGRELASDLRRAKTEQDRHEARTEYVHEIEDAQSDYAKEMSERGYRVVSFDADNGTELSMR